MGYHNIKIGLFVVNIYPMEHCCNMMTILNSIRNLSIILYMLGFCVLFMGVFYLAYNEILTSVGYMTTSILSCILVMYDK